MLPRLLPLAPMLVLAAALPSPAAAAVEHEYVAHIDVTSTHKHVQSENTPEKNRNAMTSLSTRFVVDAPLTFRNGQMTYPQGRVPVTETTNGTAESIYHDDWRDGFSNCTALTRSNPTGHAAIEQDLIAPLDGSEALNVRVTDGLTVEWDCSRISQQATFGDGGFHIDDELGYGAMDVKFSLPKESIGMGKIIQLISGPPAPAAGFCPDENETTTSCSLRWEGQMTLTKVATRTVPDWPAGGEPIDEGDDLIAPLVPPKSSTPSIDEGDDLIAPLVPPSKASVDAKGRTVSFRAGCSGGCTGTAVLTAGAGARAAAMRKPVATLRFKVPAGRVRTVRLTLPRKARSALRRAGRGTLAVTLKPKSGAAKRTKLALRLKRR